MQMYGKSDNLHHLIDNKTMIYWQPSGNATVVAPHLHHFIDNKTIIYWQPSGNATVVAPQNGATAMIIVIQHNNLRSNSSIITVLMLPV